MYCTLTFSSNAQKEFVAGKKRRKGEGESAYGEHRVEDRASVAAPLHALVRVEVENAQRVQLVHRAAHVVQVQLLHAHLQQREHRAATAETHAHNTHMERIESRADLKRSYSRVIYSILYIAG